MKKEIEDEEKYSGRNGIFLQRAVFNYTVNTPNIMNDDAMDFYTANPIAPVHYTREYCDEDTKPSMLLNLDNQTKRKVSGIGANYQDEPAYKKTLFRDYEVEEMDLKGWRKKPVEDWEKEDTKSWLIFTGEKLGQPYGRMSPYLAMPGRDILRLSRLDFINHDGIFGEKLFDLLQAEWKSKRYLPPFDTLKSSFSDDETSVGSGNNFSDGGSFNCSVDSIKKRPPGRPRTLDPKRKVAKEKLWEFIRNLLLNPQYCPQWIRWDNYDKKRFRFVQSDSVAKLWGARKNNVNMTYEKFSRAMRYYYPKKIFVAVPGRRLVYEFGDKATGLETSNPNFTNSNVYGDAVRPRDFN